LARLRHSTFTDRLVAKFRLPTEGWRGDGRGPRADVDEPPQKEGIVGGGS
jgi:NAD+ kinase